MTLPPLNALRAFEAAARHEGFIGAAEELCVTRGAVSRHVKLLEEHLGTPLFLRHSRGVSLTATGRALATSLTAAFRQIAEATQRAGSAARELRILCPPATFVRWLLPRLDGFRRRHPDIRLKVTADFHRDGFDAVAYDLGFSMSRVARAVDDIVVDPLFPSRIAPACAPVLLTGPNPLAVPGDLAAQTLLHEHPANTDWRTWLATFDVTGVDPASGDVYPNLDLATRAAVLGAGVIMADLVLCRDELASGALILPFPDKICDSDLGEICLIGPRTRWSDPKLAAFAAWARSQAEKDCARLT